MKKCLSPLDKRLNIMESLQNLYDKEQIKEKSNLLSQMVDIEDTKSSVETQIEMKNDHISTQESLQENKKKILNPKFLSSEKSIPIMKSSPTLDQVSTKKEKVIKPFWTTYSMEMSKKLWLPIKTDYQGSVLNSYNKYVKNLEPGLSLQEKEMDQKIQTLNSQKTSCPSLPFSQLDIMENVNINYSRKIRIYPNKEQHELFNKCFGASRFFYNKGVSYINDSYKQQLNSYISKSKESCIYECKDIRCENEPIDNNFYCDKHKQTKIKWDLPLSLPTLRPLVMKNDDDLNEDEQWQKEIPYDTRQLVLKDLIGNYKSCITNKKRGHIDKFELGFKSKRNLNQVFYCTKKAMSKFNIFKRRLKNKSKIKTRKRHNVYSNYKPNHDFVVMKEGFKYYIIFSKERETKYEKATHNCVSLDPGVRTFQTYYSPDGFCGKIGDNLQQTINNLSLKLDKFKSLITKETNKRTIYNMKKRCSILITKVKNIVRDLHWQSCSFLVKNFQNIVIPHFESKSMSNCTGRKINKTTTRNMLGLSHFKFLQKLEFKCKEYQRNLIITSEEYTSKTCGKCGTLNQTLGGSKTFNCNKCNVTIDRDMNGARNILIKYLTGLDTTL